MLPRSASAPVGLELINSLVIWVIIYDHELLKNGVISSNEIKAIKLAQGMILRSVPVTLKLKPEAASWHIGKPRLSPC
jgi:hypothetical protein